MAKVLCPYCSTTIVEDFNKIINLEEIEYFQCPDPECCRVVGNPFCEKIKVEKCA